VEVVGGRHWDAVRVGRDDEGVVEACRLDDVLAVVVDGPPHLGPYQVGAEEGASRDVVGDVEVPLTWGLEVQTVDNDGYAFASTVPWCVAVFRTA
jgi:hypothetical protein